MFERTPEGGAGAPNDRPIGGGVIGVAAFDFDGTLTHKDTLLPFLTGAHGWRRVAMASLAGLVAPQPRTVGRSVGHDGDATPTAPRRDRLKISTIGRLFRGMPAGRLDELGRDYATRLSGRLRAEMVERVRWHQRRGHAVVIVSASLAAYLRPVAARLGIDDVLAVELVADGDGILTGAVEGGANTRGPHKPKRVHAWTAARFGPDAPLERWAYGDAAGDRELLAWADHPTWVGQGGSLG
jgi:phosphatidylglycerophosphatase C